MITRDTTNVNRANEGKTWIRSEIQNIEGTDYYQLSTDIKGVPQYYLRRTDTRYIKVLDYEGKDRYPSSVPTYVFRDVPKSAYVRRCSQRFRENRIIEYLKSVKTGAWVTAEEIGVLLGVSPRSASLYLRQIEEVQSMKSRSGIRMYRVAVGE